MPEDKNSPPDFHDQGQKFTAEFLCPRTKNHRRIVVPKDKKSPPDLSVRGPPNILPADNNSGFLCPRTSEYVAGVADGTTIHRRVCCWPDTKSLQFEATILLVLKAVYPILPWSRRVRSAPSAEWIFDGNLDLACAKSSHWRHNAGTVFAMQWQRSDRSPLLGAPPPS